MKKDSFDPESHFESKILNGTIRSQGTVISFAKQPLTSKTYSLDKGIKRIVKENFKYEDFKKINEIHNLYLRSLLTAVDKINLNLLLKAELTGAKIEINGKQGFIIEERKNSLTVIFPNDFVKIFPKRTFNFKLLIDDFEFIFESQSLKKNRTKKLN